MIRVLETNQSKRENLNVNSSARSLVQAFMLGALAALPLAAQTASLKIAFVDSDVIFQQYPEAQEVQKRLDAMIKSWQDEINRMTEEYDTKLKDYQQKQALMTEQAKQTTEQELLSLRQKVVDYQNEKFGQTGELAQQREKLVAPLMDKIIKAIEEVAKEEGFHFIFDKSDQAPVLLYGDARFDVTFRVLDRLKRGTSGSVK